MSNIEQITRALSRLLRDPNINLICLMGAWGVGKTFFWNEFLHSRNSEEFIGGLQKYSYVSTFGLASISDFRNAIYDEAIPISDVINRGVDHKHSEPKSSITQHIFGSKRKHLTGMAARVASERARMPSLEEYLRILSFSTVKNYLICIDDLERMSNKIQIGEVLGLLQLLKERRECKIVVILNEERLEKKNEFFAHIEKIADRRVRLSLAPEEAAEIGLKEIPPKLSKAFEYSALLSITNIRTLKRVGSYLSEIWGEIEGDDQELLDRIARATVLACWAIDYPDVAPRIDFLRGYSWGRFEARAEHNPPEEKEARFHTLLSRYGFSHANQLDLAVFSSIEAGLVSGKLLREAMDEIKGSSTKVRRMGGALEDVWKNHFHGSLKISDEDFFLELYRATIDDISTISMFSVSNTIVFLRKNNQDKIAEEIIDHYIGASHERGLSYILEQLNSVGDVREVDGVLLDKMKMEVGRLVASYPREDVMASIRRSQAIDELAANVLVRLTEDEMIELIDSLEPSIQNSTIRALLSAKDRFSSIGQRLFEIVQSALFRIADRSPLTREKIIRFGLDPDSRGGMPT